MTTKARPIAVLPPDYSQGSKRSMDASAVFAPEGFTLVSTGHIQKRDLLLVMPQAVWLFATPSQLGDPVTDFRAVARPHDDAGKVEDCILVTLLDEAVGTTRGSIAASVPVKKGTTKIAHAWLATDEPAKVTLSLSKTLTLDELQFATKVLARFAERVRELDKAA